MDDEHEHHEKEAQASKMRIRSFGESRAKAPRDECGELILRRREVHSGRAMTVSTVEWSVADKIATPTSVFEGYMWDKEAEVDRFRERVPLSNLVSQCRLSAVDAAQPKPRDWFGPVKDAAKDGSFVIIPECKRMEPATGSLRKRYDIAKLTKEFIAAGVSAISVNCDGILFGGTLEDITKARDGTARAVVESATSEDGVAVPPILASDLLLYPYQLYKLRLAGADAVNLMVAALETKDLVYLAKIAASLQMQTFVTVTSTKQIEDLSILPAGSIKGIIVSNRNLEDFSFDMTGQQALDILMSEAALKFREKHGNDNTAILVEGRVGIVTGDGASPQDYIKRLKEAGAIGAIVGTGLVPDDVNKSPLTTLLQAS
jgi:indole-3-glycerol phosphate synthase